MHPRPVTRTAAVRLVDAVWARRVAAELDRAGLPASELLREVGLRREQLTKPDAHIPFAAHVRLLEHAAQALKEPCFGFRLGSAVEVTEAGLLAYLVLSSRDLREALRNGCRYLAISTEGAVAELQEEAGEARLLLSVVDLAGMTSRQLVEFAVTRLVRHLGALTGHRVRLIRVELVHDPACPGLPRRLGLPVVVHQPHNAVVFEASSLTLPVIDADARLLAILQRYSDDLLAQRPQGDLVTSVERCILENLHTGELGMAELARSLGMSTRTLRRRLAEQDLTPAQLVDQLRQELAKRYLAEGTFPLGQITYLLGYGDLATFTRAFRRWTGTTPTTWRADLRQMSAASPRQE
jgi:AraC-like DNA-binding protein